ncbi:MAG: 50S ribosomal protein L18 [Ignavibacteria bacterium]|jgi:large subunit ribosomal protein L18|nr:50S ribosomal protein L18 [Ignavibacteria bacterium]
MTTQALKQKRKLRRKLRIRKKIFGTQNRLRLSVFKSVTNIYAQLIDDVEGKTIISASSIDKETRNLINSEMNKTEVSKVVGQMVAKRAKEANITKIVFDRNGNVYRGRVKALADAAREAGLEF